MPAMMHLGIHKLNRYRNPVLLYINYSFRLEKDYKPYTLTHFFHHLHLSLLGYLRQQSVIINSLASLCMHKTLAMYMYQTISTTVLAWSWW